MLNVGRNSAFFLLVIILASSSSVAWGQSASGVYSTYNYYNPSSSGYSFSGLYCDTYDGNQPYSWRSQYYWTAFCGTAGGPMGPSLCGRCLRVTNPSTGQSVTVRIVDQCSNGGLDLEWNAFNAIDANGQGYAAGHLYTNYVFVSC